MTVVQDLDGVVGVLANDPSKTYGPFAFAVLNVLAVIWLLRGEEVIQPSPITSQALVPTRRCKGLRLNFN
jgi:hypothetical protein